MTSVMELCDHKCLEHYDENGMGNCDEKGMVPFCDRVQGAF